MKFNTFLYRSSKLNFDVPPVTKQEMNNINMELDRKKAPGFEEIPGKILKIFTNITDSHLKNIINYNLFKKSFIENANVVSVSSEK